MAEDRGKKKKMFEVRIALTFCFIAVSVISVGWPALAENDGGGAGPKKLPHETLTGTVRSLGIVQEEPGATPQVNFYLDVTEADGNVEAVLISMPVYRPFCSEGELAVIEGDLAAADATFPAMLFSPHVVSCNAVKP